MALPGIDWTGYPTKRRALVRRAQGMAQDLSSLILDSWALLGGDAKSVTTKKAAKKVGSRSNAVKNAPAKKSPAKKASKKSPAKKAAKKSPAKKAAKKAA